MLKMWRVLALCAAVLVTMGGVASGQDTPPGGGERPDRPPPDARLTGRDLAALAAALDQYALVQARRTLQLDESQSAQFLPRLRDLQQLRRRNNMQRNRLLQDLRRLVGPRTGPAPGDEAAVRAALGALREHDERAAQELRAAYEALEAVLNPRQQARFRLFEEQIESRKLELLLNARARAARGGGS